MRRFTIGDIHGRIKALLQCLERSGFDYENDLLIVLGDIADGGYNTYECVEELLKIKHIIFIMGNHDCIHENTDILTEKGWMNIKEYKPSIKAANFSPTTGRIYFNYPIRKLPLIKKKLIAIESYDSKQIVSYNHDVIIDGQKIKAKDLLGKTIKSNQIRCAGIWNKSKGIKISNPMLGLLTWTCMDGCIYQSTPNKIRVQFKLSKPDKIKKLKNIMKQAKIKYTLHKATKTGLNVLQPYFIRVYGEYAKNIQKLLEYKKNIPSYFRNMNQKQYEIFLQALLDTDGHKSYGKIVISTVNKHNADIIQEIAISHAHRCTIAKKGRSGFKNGKQQYRIHIHIEKEYNYPVSIKNYGEGLTSCITMPRRNIISRIDGKVAFTGNCWFINHIKSGWAENIWLHQGGKETIKSYGGLMKLSDYIVDPSDIIKDINVPVTHQEFFNNAKYWYELDGMLFVHGGYDPRAGVRKSSKQTLLWDRELIEYAREKPQKPWKKIFVGHTTTQTYGDATVPLKFNNLIMMDTGAGWTGRLTIMNIDTEEYWQSDMQQPGGR